MKNLAAESGQGINDLIAARGWLDRQLFVDRGRIGVVGLCLGGGFAMVLAKTGLFQVAAPFYGPVPVSLHGACPMVASFGGRDRIMTPGAARLEAALAAQDVPHDVKTYADAGHGFMNEAPNAVLGLLGRHSPVRAGHDPEAAGDAMDRMRRFLDAHL
jgi:carboxymethylenebutenolidase